VLAIVVVGGTATAAAAGLTASNGRSRAFDCSAATADPDPGHLPAWIAQSWSGVGWLGARSGGRAHLIAGRWQLHQVADWPGAVVVLPLLAVWTIGLTLAWVAVRRVVGRARFAEQPTSVALDDRLRTESARRIVAACGALFMVPSGMVLRTMGDSLLHACNPTGASFPGRYLLDLANVLVVLALIAVLGYPTSARASRVPAAGAPTGTAVTS
jgi:hypothetical protein